MERLWRPWRSEYVTAADGGDGCVFCEHLTDPDDDGVLYRAEAVFVLLNAFPYNSGHVMVAPTRHVGETKELTAAESHELMDVTLATVDVLRESLEAHGFNIGMNLGRVAGAGVPGHLHVHVVPRWGGDTNFMPVIGESKVLPEILSQTRARLMPVFERALDRPSPSGPSETSPEA
jgi:ATP adenylyltransferase